MKTGRVRVLDYLVCVQYRVKANSPMSHFGVVGKESARRDVGVSAGHLGVWTGTPLHIPAAPR